MVVELFVKALSTKVWCQLWSIAYAYFIKVQFDYFS